jgi:hypothetical protein
VPTGGAAIVVDAADVSVETVLSVPLYVIGVPPLFGVSVQMIEPAGAVDELDTVTVLVNVTFAP